MILSSIVSSYIQSGEFSGLSNGAGKISIEGVAPSSFSFIIASLFAHNPVQTLVVVKNYQRMHELYLDITCFTDPGRVVMLPSWETLPYEFVSPSEKIERERVSALYRLLKGDPVIVVTPLESLLRAIPGKEFFLRKGFLLTKGEEYPFEDLVEQFVEYGYSREYRIESPGQFSVKGSIIDIFPPAMDNPVRFDFFGDTLDSIREFDINTQRSYGEQDEVTVYPRKEIILSKNERDAISEVLREAEERGLSVPAVNGVSDIMEGEMVPGIEDLFPLIMEPRYLPSFLTGDACIIFSETTELGVQKDVLEKTFTELYRKKVKTSLAVDPALLLNTGLFDEILERAVELRVFTARVDALHWKLRGIPNFQGRIKSVREEIARRIDDGWRVIVTTGFEGQARRLFDLLADFSPDSNFEKLIDDNALNIVILPLREGFEIEAEKVLVLTDHEIFGKSYRKKSQFKKKSSRALESVLDLREGDYIVHINHGIGIFRGLERMEAGGVERDFILVEYAGGDRLYVSLDQITMVQRYIGLEGKAPRIDALGKKSAWNKIKEKVQKSIEELAKDLIEIYAKRQAMKGFPFPPDTLWQEEFEAKFEFEETPDQITAIEDVKDDMEATQPMDRLICGDVGFGKTEVAIRSAFKAVMAGKQVAVLVPTTVLCMQHFSTFKKRFADYPVKIEMISRFRTRGEATAVKSGLAEGSVDIVIGTHALLGKDVAFKNVGLLIIDEEQRFGVKHKEQIKKIRTLIDVLTLSATPIPRTLHMAIAGIKDISIILTPPENRQSIDTYVLEDNPDITRMSILNEIERGGQVFYVHNRVETIDIQARMLKELVPEASFCVAHGQMKEHELEEVVIDFLEGKHEVLVSTTIIESGLDMPNVNTILINRADTFGLSQLYQLKGRVGRSITKAYAYLFYPPHVPLSETAQKRLQVVSEFSELGSGFKIAMKDLEIRGSGNILGREQSGDIMDVGFDLYSQMLEDAVRALKGESAGPMFRTPVFLKTDFYIPESYIEDERQKIEFYKRLESCETVEEVESLENEMQDRFGQMPGEVVILVELEKVRAIASSLLIEEIIEDRERETIKIRVSKDTKISVDKTITLIKKDTRLSIDRGDREIILFKPVEREDEKKIRELKKWLQQLS
ncbi:MAG TPA: transcription-repair coupling factor [Spirochaetota bacterium]|nr:transcription-repair coupling factor [Spirochaetota bacterium]